MQEWKKVMLAEEPEVRAWRVDLDHEESALRVVAGAHCSVLIEGGPVNVLGTLTPAGPALPVADLQHGPLTTRRDTLEGIAEPVYAIQVVGTGTVTLFAVRR